MKVFITGGTGFIGSHLVRALLKSGHHPTVLTRSPSHARKIFNGDINIVEGDPSIKGNWMSAVAETEFAVNLVGESIFGRWTKSRKEAIVQSRLNSTHNLVEAIKSMKPSKFTLVSASAVGFYGYHEDEELTEDDLPGDDFLAKVAVQWEHEAIKAESKDIRVVLLRSGIVLGKGGALMQMIRPFKLYGGGPLGSGAQYVSWIHIDDETGLIIFALENDKINGPINATSPNPVTNAEFSRVLGEVIHRPSWMRAPPFSIRMVLGEFADAILNGQRVMPAKVSKEGYSFLYPDLRDALTDLLAVSNM